MNRPQDADEDTEPDADRRHTVGYDTDDFPGKTHPKKSSEGAVTRILGAQLRVPLAVRDVALGLAVFGLVAAILFAVTGVWPPLVAVQSDSMTPHVHRGDMLVLTEPGRYMRPPALSPPGVITAADAREFGIRSFGGYGSVIVYEQPRSFGPPVVHRVRFRVARGEDWYDRADPRYLGAKSCRELRNCPAPHAGYITRGDANPVYDQAAGISPPVRGRWIRGVARLRIPFLGWGHVLLRELATLGR